MFLEFIRARIKSRRTKWNLAEKQSFYSEELQLTIIFIVINLQINWWFPGVIKRFCVKSKRNSVYSDRTEPDVQSETNELVVVLQELPSSDLSRVSPLSSWLIFRRNSNKGENRRTKGTRRTSKVRPSSSCILQITRWPSTSDMSQVPKTEYLRIL